jgi:tetratricopeptide (TPR) repeat protein
METTIMIMDLELEYDFLSAWIKYTRMKKGMSQEALSHGICSISHLSYFENGRKHLRKEIIEALLKRLKIGKINNLSNIGLIRQKLNSMMNDIEGYNYEGAKEIYTKLLEIEKIIKVSPYIIEFRIYELMYKFFTEDFSYDNLKEDINLLDKVSNSLNDNLKYLYLFVSGNIMYRHHLNEQGINRLMEAMTRKDTSWINFTLGRALCFNNDPAKGSYYLEKALDNYEKSGRYLNAVWCHNYLGVCYSYLRIFDVSLKHFNAALMSAKHFDMDKLFYVLYNNLSHLYLNKGDYEESIHWSSKAMETNNMEVLAAYNYVSACLKLNKRELCTDIFKTYLGDQFKTNEYYNAIYFQYLVTNYFQDEFFYHEVKFKILPYFENIKRGDICRDIKLKLIEYLESRRRYKDANKLYKELI